MSRAARLWAEACGVSASEKAASHAARKAVQSAFWNAHLGFRARPSVAVVVLVEITIGRRSLPRSGPTLHVDLRARPRPHIATSGAVLLPER